jgi:hypothetical protein
LEKSFKFKHIENNLLKILALLLNNENIKKYIYYLVDNPISQPNVTQNLIQSKHIILTPFNPNILSQEKVCLFLNPYEGNFKNSALSDLVFLVDIIIPSSKWLLNGLGQIRCFRLADEISQLLDQQKIAGMTEVEIFNFRIYKVDDSYSGLSLKIKVNSSSMKGLR